MRNVADEQEVGVEDLSDSDTLKTPRDGVTNTRYPKPEGYVSEDPARDFFKSMDIILKRRTKFTRKEIECIVSEHSQESASDDQQRSGEANIEPCAMLSKIELVGNKMRQNDNDE